MVNPDEKFKVVITSQRHTKNGLVNTSLWGLLPDRVDMEVSSEWDTPLAPSGGGPLFTAIRLVASELGASPYSKFMTVALWAGSAPIQMTIPLEFSADNEQEHTQMLTNIKTLMKMTLPGEIGDSGMLSPPGPTPDNGWLAGNFFNKIGAFFGGEDINISLGNFLEFKKVVILRVAPSWHMTLARNGKPMRCTVLIQFRTYNTPTKNDLDAMFK